MKQSTINLSFLPLSPLPHGSTIRYGGLNLDALGTKYLALWNQYKLEESSNGAVCVVPKILDSITVKSIIQES